jgi:hypothetical protein
MVMTASEQLTSKLLTTSYLLVGAQMPDEVVVEMVRLLKRYPLEWVLGALERCCLELKTQRLSIQDITSRFDDGRPGPEEAWAMVSAMDSFSNEAVVWTDGEMNCAWGVARGLIDMGEIVQARMAFLESYKRLVAEARGAGRPPCWILCPGSHSSMAAALPEAVRKGRLTREYAAKMLGYLAPEELQALLPAPQAPALQVPDDRAVTQVREMVQQLASGHTIDR